MAGKSPPAAGSKPTQIRDDRLKAALKANLARRKAQVRARAGGPTGEADKKTGKSKG